jgi:hypothetical protein
MTHWLVYTRQDCSLCETLLEELAQVLGPLEAARVEVVDIGDDPELERKYGRRLPVLLADGEFLCDYRLDRGRLGPFL